ncbi:MAG TPA: O-antigen translocase, partial [Edaphobacter sp.]|nr:O-antigen translocase [Edaphobacter sp.]
SVEQNTQTSASPLQESPSVEKGTYGQILKSSALVGGSSVLNILIGMVRTKVMALLLGPAGFGLLSVYGSIVTLTQTFAGMGVNSSGVRQIAEASGSNELEHIARITFILRRISLLLGVLGAVFLVVFSRQVSSITFGTTQHVAAVSLLSVAVLFALVSAGQGALIQGMRRISDLAKMGTIGAFLGTLCSILLVYLFRDRGVVPSLIAVAVMTALTSWWYSRKIRIQTPSLTAAIFLRETSALLKLGFAFMVSGLMTMGVAYVIRITVLRKVGFEATGLYQAAWTLGGLYVGFILQAMGADFYPRLTTHANDNPICNRLVNEQAQVGLLLAGPGVLATLTFAPLVVSLFYSAKFGAAVGILRWICLGTIIQVVSWPMGFIIIAKARQTLFIVCELAWAIVSLGLAWVCISDFGLDGVGIAFFASYIFHAFLIYAVVNRISGFRWSSANRRLGILFLVVIAAAFAGFYLLPFFVAVSLGTVATVSMGAYSLHTLIKLISFEQIPSQIRRLLIGVGIAPRSA